MESFQISFLDHVAVKVRNLDASIEWYERVLGLKRCVLHEWGKYPVLLLAGKSGVALFQVKGLVADTTDERKIRIDHFAFNVSKNDFEAAKRHYKSIGQEFEFQDHFYFHSIYTKDPDGHTVELTTIIADETSVYK